MTYYTYIITNHTNSVLYTGVTNDLIKRSFQHKKGLINTAFTKRYRLYKIIWFQEFTDIKEAIAAEKKIKGWTRTKKMQLIKSINPKLKNLIA